ncbi:MAG TPA: FAD-dependent oxidoreductase [Thermoanaerobaculia bacterium]|nr:FAD-dependent oxidoreductase [Thermoanaerobaculia bacterium]
MISRRDLLVSFLGAPFARCARESRIALPPGDLVGASDAIGHRLRGAPPPWPSSFEDHEIVIVGAGVAGLAAAWRLAHAGVRDVLVLELESVAGGTARSGASRVSAFPWGAHYVPAPMPENRALIRLLREIGVMDGDVVAEQFLCRDPEERIFYRGHWYEGLYLTAGASNEDLRQLRAFEAEIAKWIAWRDARGRRAFAIPTAMSSDDAEVTALDRISMRAWLDGRHFTSPRLRWLVEYACRDDYGSLLDDTSAWAGVFYFASRIAVTGEDSQPLITFPEGNGRLVAHLGKFANVRTHMLVANIIPTDAGAEITAIAGDQLHGIRAKHVIFAAPQFIAPHVIAPWRESPPPHVREFSYGSWLVANLTLRDRPSSRGFPLAWDNVLYESPSLGYVVATHQRGIDHGPTVFTYYYALCDRDPRHARERLLSAGRDEWAEVALSDLERAHPEIRTLTERVDVMRWGHAMIRPRPQFVWSDARRRAREPYRNIHFAHSDLSGVALFEEALYHGIRAAEEVLPSSQTWL